MDIHTATMMDQPVLSRVTFALAAGVTGYLCYQCMKPPTPPRAHLPTETKVLDSIAFRHSFTMLAAYRVGLAGLSAWVACFALFPHAFCPFGTSAEFPLNPNLLTWTKFSALMLFFTAVNALGRLQAMGQLGKNFTFELREPDRLDKTGLYRWVQHPSYTTGIVVFGLSATFFIRADGVMGLLMPGFDMLGSEKQKLGTWIWYHQAYFNVGVSAAVWLGSGFGGWRRIRDEERMLKHKFGKEWVEWHNTTARLVPFVF